MATSSKKVRLRYALLYAAAKAKVRPNPDKSVIEANVRIELAKILRDEIDVIQMSEAKAAAIVEALTKQPDDDDGQFSLNLGSEDYPYNPERLIKDDDGNIIEEDLAKQNFKMAELARSGEHLGRAATWNTRKVRQFAHFQKWVSIQLSLGRDDAELTWGNCVRETGILRQK